MHTSDKVKAAINRLGSTRVRMIIYGQGFDHEYIGMAKFIDSRQDHVKESILGTLESLKHDN